MDSSWDGYLFHFQSRFFWTKFFHLDLFFCVVLTRPEARNLTLLESAGHVGIPLSRIRGSTGILEVGCDGWNWLGYLGGDWGSAYGGVMSHS